MVWRETFPPADEFALDAETERERRLAAQARAGADWALTALIARYQPAVTRYLTRLCGDHVRARLLAEQVFQRMERRLHGPQGAENLRLWLLRASTEAGLEALRRPGRARAWRLGAAQIAGLLPAETGVGAQKALRGGIKRLRNVVGAVSRQARPLVWQEKDGPQRAPSQSQDGRNRETAELGPVDESLDTLDPREALRHRLIRITLAELPYGDAQCLALHLVAGLNQAEVARALGITNSAARKRIVQGLSQFATRYEKAVASFGLPEELGYGPAARQPIEVEPPAAEPVIVPQKPDEMDSEMGQFASSTIPLTVDAFDDGEAISSVTYYEASSEADDSPIYPAPVESAHFMAEDEAGDLSGRYAPPFPSPADMAEMGASAASQVVEEEGAEFADDPDVSFPGHGGIMRIAADAIVGPVVDALPVHSEPLTLTPEAGFYGPRSTPLAYELDSSVLDAQGVTMNWIDATGMMVPLSLEAMITPAPVDEEPESGDEPWERPTALEMETSNTLEPLSDSLAESGEDVLLDYADAEPPDSSQPPLDMSIALHEGDYGWERAHPGETAQAAQPVTRSLEDLWDEAPDVFGR